MKKVFLILISLLTLSHFSNAQIALTYDDTLICRGDTITMGASVTGQLSNLQFDDDFTAAVNIGFPFVYFGNTYNQVVISDNNFFTFDLSLAGGGYSAWTYNTATGNGQLNNAVMLGFCDLLLDPAYGNGSGSVQYQTFGNPGSRKFVIQYCNAAKYSGACGLNKVYNQVILYEGSNIIEFHTQDMPGTPGCPTTNNAGNGGNGIQGLRYVNGANINQVFTPGRGPADLWGTIGGQMTSRRFTPTAAAPFYTVDSIAYNPWQIIQQANSNLLRWYDANGTYLTQSATLTLPVSNPPPPAPSTFFIVEYTGPAGCDGSQSFTYRDTVTVRFSDIKTYRTESMCAGSSFNFYGRELVSPGIYDTTFQSAIGCDSTIILTLNVNPLPPSKILAGEKVKICQGDSYLFKAEKGATQYQWQKDGIDIPGANSDTLNASQPGVYTVVTTSEKECSKTSNAVELVYAPNPTVKINYISSNDICAMDTVELNALAVGENIEYVWGPDDYYREVEGSSTHKSVKAIVPQSGYLWVKVYNNDLCTAMDSVFIKAEPCCELRMPNAFTPNGDDKNDYFIPSLEVGQKLIKLQVYNRYGEMVFDADSYRTKGWDGKDKKGNKVDIGVYMYVMVYSCSDGKNYEKKGDVTLMR